MGIKEVVCVYLMEIQAGRTCYKGFLHTASFTAHRWWWKSGGPWWCHDDLITAGRDRKTLRVQAKTCRLVKGW